MRIARKLLIPVFAVALILAGALILSWADGDVALSGITVEDAHPNGCVDCHKQSNGNDYRLTTGLKELGHPDIARIVRNVPEDCAMCHKANAPAGSLGEVTHVSHYANPDENVFVNHYGGECLACHALNTSTGAMSNKSGPKNW